MEEIRRIMKTHLIEGFGCIERDIEALSKLYMSGDSKKSLVKSTNELIDAMSSLIGTGRRFGIADEEIDKFSIDLVNAKLCLHTVS